MLFEPMSICRVLVGLADVDVVGTIPWTTPMQVHIASTFERPSCVSCGTAATVKETMRRRLVDLPSFGRAVVTVWRQVRWRCPDATCPVGSWMQTDPRIVIGNRGMTDRAARWACEQVGRHGRSVAGGDCAVVGEFAPTAAPRSSSGQSSGTANDGGIRGLTSRTAGERRRVPAGHTGTTAAGGA